MIQSPGMPPRPASRRSLLAIVFLSSVERRLRAGWRLILQALFQIILTVAASVVLLLAPAQSATGGGPAILPPGLAIAELVQVAVVTVSVFVARRLLDKRSLASLGLILDGATVVQIGVGIGITFAMMALIFLGEWSLGWLRIDGFSWMTMPIPIVVAQGMLWFGIFILVAWNEELMSRGYHLQTIASGMGLIWGLVISSAIFGLLHLGNPNANWVSAAGILLAGLLLGYAYIRTRRLWLSIGLHIGWNFFEGVVFGFPVSGLSTYNLMRITVSGPELWTGGAFGPEAGLIVVPAIAFGAVLIYVCTRARTPDEEAN